MLEETESGVSAHKWYRLILAVSFFALLLSGMPAHAQAQPAQSAESDRYMLGYVQALLDQHFPTLELSPETSEQGQVIVRSTTCLDVLKQSEVRYKLTQAPAVTQVLLEMPCAAAEKEQLPKFEVENEALPETAIFDALIADPREARFGVTVAEYDTEGDDFTAGIAQFGHYIGLYEGDRGVDRWQFGLDAGVFALFNLDATSKDLINADYYVGFPLTYRRTPWSFRARLYHISSHLGDEFILGNPNVQRVNLSYEVIDGLASWEWKALRLYGGGGYIINSTPDLDPGLAQAGFELRFEDVIWTADLEFAADYKATEEQDWESNISLAGGLNFSRARRPFRVLLTYYDGLSPNGQFFNNELSYWGLNLHFNR